MAAVKDRALRLLFQFARSPMGRRMVGWSFENLSSVLPFARISETPRLLVFHHPQPSYPLHILLVPKKAVGSLTELAATDCPFLLELFQTIDGLVTRFDLEREGYRLIVNGGAYQDVPQLHFHLVSGDPL